jgi:hypothetical protein
VGREPGALASRSFRNAMIRRLFPGQKRKKSKTLASVIVNAPAINAAACASMGLSMASAST